MQVGALNELWIAPKERLRDRLAARLHRLRLDAALASGTPTEASTELALRARRLTNMSFRRELARTIGRLVRGVDTLAPPSRVRISPQWGRVAAAADALSELADALSRPKPVSARGVAQALILLTDGTGPLFNPHNYGSVRNRASAATANLTIDAAQAGRERRSAGHWGHRPL
jgi:hypothetical protein